MTRQEQIEQIDNKYQERLSALQGIMTSAQDEYTNIIETKNVLFDAVNRYYDALEKKTEIDAIIDNGAPTI